MRSLARWMGSAALVLALAGAAGAAARDPADLVPAQTLAWVEVRQPARLAQEMTALLKGSALEDMPAALARFRARRGDKDQFWYLANVGMFGVVFSPEMMREGARLEGAALALTGFTREREPEYVGIVLAGESNMPTLILRTALLEGNTRQAGEAEGVAIYRQRRMSYRSGPPGTP